MTKRINWPLTLILIGSIIWIAGELLGATNKVHGDTFSEWWGSQPEWVTHVFSAIGGGVFVHLIRWTYNLQRPATITAGDNATINIDETTEPDEEHA